jgi:hypothetical protein
MTREKLLIKNEQSKDPRYALGRDRKETGRLIQQSRLDDGLLGPRDS